MKPLSFKTLLAWITVVSLVDQLTKWWIVSAFAIFESRPIIPGLFNLTFVTNTGAAFGMLAGEQSVWRQVFFVGVALAALVILLMAHRQYRDRGTVYGAGIALVAGGAVGNLIDRLRLGHVVDFLDFYVRGHHWPAFNIADSAITVGVAIFLLASCLDHESPAGKGGAGP